MDYSKKVIQIAEDHNGQLPTRLVDQAGIAREYIIQLVNNRKLIQVDRGYYILPEVLEDILFRFSHKYRKGIFSHYTALYLHNLSDRYPFRHTMTFPSGYNATKAKTNIDVYFVTKERNKIGLISMVSEFGNEIPVFDMERTIVDIIRNRNHLDSDIVKVALNRYVNLTSINIHKLMKYSQEFNIKEVLSKRIEQLI